MHVGLLPTGTRPKWFNEPNKNSTPNSLNRALSIRSPVIFGLCTQAFLLAYKLNLRGTGKENMLLTCGLWSYNHWKLPYQHTNLVIVEVKTLPKIPDTRMKQLNPNSTPLDFISRPCKWLIFWPLFEVLRLSLVLHHPREAAAVKEAARWSSPLNGSNVVWGVCQVLKVYDSQRTFSRLRLAVAYGL